MNLVQAFSLYFRFLFFPSTSIAIKHSYTRRLYIAPTTLLLHHKNCSEANFALDHVVHSILHLIHGELLDHALNAVQVSERDGLLAV